MPAIKTLVGVYSPNYINTEKLCEGTTSRVLKPHPLNSLLKPSSTIFKDN